MTTPLQPDEKHALLIGKIVSNLLSLEFLLRAIQAKTEADAAPPGTFKHNLSGLKVGDSVPVDALTNYDQLRDLIRKHNVQARAGEEVPEDIVKLRDALAHGRVSTTDPAKPLELVKFGPDKGKKGFVDVVIVETMTESWLDAQKERTKEAINRALTCARRLRI